MKPIRADEHFDDILKHELELDYMPDQVTRRLQQVYFELPDPLPVKRRHTGLKAVYASLSAVAAAVLLLFGLNAINPVFAEEIPLIGGFFRQINAGRHNADTVDTERIEQHAVVPAEEDGQNLVTENDVYAMEVRSVYFDGRFLLSALELKSDIDIRENGYMLGTQILLNGEPVYASRIDFGEDVPTEDTPYIHWMSTGNGSYVGNLQFTVPEKYRTGEPLQVEYLFTLQDMREYNDYLFDTTTAESQEEMEPVKPIELGEGPHSISFEAVPDQTEVTKIAVTCESAGAVLSEFYTSPAGTDIGIQVPIDSDYGAHAKLYTEAGKEIGEFQTGSNHLFTGYASGPTDTRFAFGGLKAEYKLVILQITIFEDNEDQGIYRIAEFTIDMGNRTITASENHRDKESFFYDSIELKMIRPTMYPTYRAPDEMLSLSDGYAVEYLSSGGLHKSAYLTIATPEDYRDLRVELYVDGQLRTVETTKPESEGYNNFLSMSDYVYDPNGICSWDGNIMILDSGNIERPQEIKERLNLQVLSMGDVFFYMDDVATVKIYDVVSGELLHEETHTLVLPENAEMPEGYRLYKQQGYSSYVFANPDELP